MSDRLEVLIRELTPDLLPDYLDYFDHDAFVEHPEWAKCYCYFYFAPHHLKDWEERTADENRLAVSQLIQNREMHGYLAYTNDRVVGWCNANPRRSFLSLSDENEPLADQIGSIVCFNVLPAYRGQGVATQLLHAACTGFTRQGLEIAEAYPRNDTLSSTSNYHGPLSMYLSAGFERFRELGEFTIVRKKLIPTD